MALYHFSVRNVSRGKGQMVVASAAYISGQRIFDSYYNKIHDYTSKSGVIFTEILTPEYVPERLTDRETLWNEVEHVERNNKAQLAYSFDIALQNELTLEENIRLAKEFCQEQFVARGMIVDLAVHEGKAENEEEPDNPHFHVLVPIRPFTEEGIWGNKQRREYILDEDGNRVKDAKGKDMFNAVSTTGWNDPELLKEWRRAWTEKVNGKFRECHMASRIDHRSYKEQGIDLIPTIHEGYEVRAMEKKGIKTVIGELNRAIRQFNQMFISLKESIQWMKTAYEEMKAELDRRQNPTLLESLQDYYDKKTQGRPPLPNFYAEMKQRGKNLSNLQEFAKSISYLQTHQIETMDDLQERIEELNGVVSVSKKEISEKRKQLKELENLEKMAEVIKTNQPLIDEYNHFYFQKRRERYYQQHKKEINYYRKCERELKQHLDSAPTGSTAVALLSRFLQESLSPELCKMSGTSPASPFFLLNARKYLLLPFPGHVWQYPHNSVPFLQMQVPPDTADYLLSALRSPPGVLLSPVSIWQLGLSHFDPDAVLVPVHIYGNN